MPPMRPEEPPTADSGPPPLLLMDAGPTAVHVSVDSGLVGSIVKIRKLVLAWSATGSPRPLLGRGFWKVSDQLLRWPAVPSVLTFETDSVHAPPTFSPLNPGVKCTLPCASVYDEELSSGFSERYP